MASFSEIANKKVAGIPVIYLAAAGVIGLAFVAYKMKSTVETPQDNSGAGEPGSGDGSTNPQDPYDGYETTGTVVVQPQPAPAPEVVEETNEKWEKAAVEWLSKERKASDVGTASVAIRTYLDGGDLTYEQGQLRDLAVDKFGLPPEGLPQVGRTNEDIARKQISILPGNHIVKNSNDNSPSKIAAVYYGSSDALHTNKIVAANPKLGPSGTTYSVGTKVYVPQWVTPGYFVATAQTRSGAAIAAKSGISQEVLQALNPGMTFPVAVGTRVRNH